VLFLRRFSRGLIHFLSALLLVGTAYGQSSETAVINFPVTTNTFITKCDSADSLPSPSGFVLLQRGQFILHNGITVFATANAGFTGCTNFMTLSFSPAATHVSFQLLNLNSLPDVITVFKADGIVKYALPAHGSAQVTADGNIASIGLSPQINNFSFGIAALTVTQPSPSVTELFALFETPGATPAKFQKQASPGMKIQVALGTLFSVGLQKRAGFLDPVVTLPSIAGRSVASVQPAQMLLPTATVLPKVVEAFPKDALTDLGDGRFMAVHLGRQTISVLSSTTTLPPITLTVEVIVPSALGSTLNERDRYFAMVAHNSGIPPQYVKGQARQEKGGRTFDVANWRYEPCGTDYESVSLGPTLAFTDTKYTPFRLDDARGDTLIPFRRDDIDPRNVFFIRRLNPETNRVEDIRLNDGITGVTARELWDDNDTVTGNGHIRQNWTMNCGKEKRRLPNAPNSTALDFIAQTGLASTYGYQQVGWEEAKADSVWSGVTIEGQPEMTNYKAPKYLFDRDEYINIGGGSTQLGTNLVARRMLRFGEGRFASFADLEGSLAKAYYAYNRGLRENGKTYDELVVDKSRLCYPVQTENVFP